MTNIILRFPTLLFVFLCLLILFFQKQLLLDFSDLPMYLRIHNYKKVTEAGFERNSCCLYLQEKQSKKTNKWGFSYLFKTFKTLPSNRNLPEQEFIWYINFLCEPHNCQKNIFSHFKLVQNAFSLLNCKILRLAISFELIDE